jgi:hypothetical protein
LGARFRYASLPLLAELIGVSIFLDSLGLFFPEVVQLLIVSEVQIAKILRPRFDQPFSGIGLVVVVLDVVLDNLLVKQLALGFTLEPEELVLEGIGSAKQVLVFSHGGNSFAGVAGIPHDVGFLQSLRGVIPIAIDQPASNCREKEEEREDKTGPLVAETGMHVEEQLGLPFKWAATTGAGVYCANYSAYRLGSNYPLGLRDRSIERITKKARDPNQIAGLRIVWLETGGNGKWYALPAAGLSPATAGKDYLSSAGAGGVASAAGAATAAVGVAQPVQPVETTVPQLLQPVEQPLLQPVEQPVLQPVEQLLLQLLLLRRLKTRKLRVRPLLQQSLVPQAVPQLLQLLVATVPQPQSELAGT